MHTHMHAHQGWFIIRSSKLLFLVSHQCLFILKHCCLYFHYSAFSVTHPLIHNVSGVSQWHLSATVHVNVQLFSMDDLKW